MADGSHSPAGALWRPEGVLRTALCPTRGCRGWGLGGCVTAEDYAAAGDERLGTTGNSRLVADCVFGEGPNAARTPSPPPNPLALGGWPCSKCVKQPVGYAPGHRLRPKRAPRHETRRSKKCSPELMSGSTSEGSEGPIPPPTATHILTPSAIPLSHPRRCACGIRLLHRLPICTPLVCSCGCLCTGGGGGGVGMPPLVCCARLQPAAPIGRLPFAAVPSDPSVHRRWGP